ncbi:putative hem peroxidase superfamily, hem peroxidase, animal-type [Helianthus anomalus]
MQILQPDPMVVATKLLTRREFKGTGKQFNMIAASWIQFMIHDWIDHLEETNQVYFTCMCSRICWSSRWYRILRSVCMWFMRK